MVLRVQVSFRLDTIKCQFRLWRPSIVLTCDEKNKRSKLCNKNEEYANVKIYFARKIANRVNFVYRLLIVWLNVLLWNINIKRDITIIKLKLDNVRNHAELSETNLGIYVVRICTQNQILLSKNIILFIRNKVN